MTVVRQFSRYVMVGVLSNALLYAAYLALTALGVPPKAAMTVTYAAGIILSFHMNRRWTFDVALPYGRALGRYVMLYLSGYVLNYAGLALFADALGLPHQLVQITIMAVLAAYFFVMFRLWVFKPV